MTPYSEFEGKNVEKASIKASKELNIPLKELRYNVISHGSTGIFGLVGVKKARIRIVLPPNFNAEPDPIVESTQQIPEIETDIAEIYENVNETTNDDQKEEIPKEEIPDETSNSFSSELESDDKEEVEVDDVQDDPAILGEEVLQRIIDFITTGAVISVTKRSGRIYFHVTGGHSGILIGKHGQTLEAIQYLVEKVINKRYEQRIRIQIDIEDYLEDRRFNLQKLSTHLAEKAKRTARPVTIGQMNSHDRRIVHLALKDDNDVRTQSMGTGFLKKLVIFPRRKSHRKED